MKFNEFSVISVFSAAAFLNFVRAADLSSIPATRAGDVSQTGTRRMSPKLNPDTALPTELMAGKEISQSVGAGKRAIQVEGVAGDEHSITSPAALPNTMDGLNDKRRLGVGDKLSFKIVEDEIAPRTLNVTDSLEIDVPYIGRVPVDNKTCKQFAYYVKHLLEKEYYYQATVLVGLDSAGAGVRAASRGKVYVMGQVRSQGAMDIPLDEVLTVTKAILRAGGFGPYANKKNVKLIRGGKSGSAAKPIIINCAEILDKGQWDKDIELNPDDIVTVPEKLINLF